MSFNILAVREADAAADPAYPTPGEQPDSVELTELDGRPESPVTASELVVQEIQPGGSPKRVLRLHDIKAKLVVTQSRVTVACSKYEKGGGRVGFGAAGLAVATTANVVSKARASKRRQGKMLVGHLPYHRLISVGYKPRSLPIGHDQLRLGTMDPTQTSFRGLLLDIALPRQYPAADIARRIAGLAAAYQLDHRAADLDHAQLELMAKLKDAPPLQPIPKQFASYFLIDDTRAADVATAFRKS